MSTKKSKVNNLINDMSEKEKSNNLGGLKD